MQLFSNKLIESIELVSIFDFGILITKWITLHPLSNIGYVDLVILEQTTKHGLGAPRCV